MSNSISKWNKTPARIAVLLVFIALRTSVPTFAQQDPQAVTILSQCVTAAGGTSAIASVSDFVGTGTATLYLNNQITAPATIKARGAQQFRVDATLPNGTRSWAVSYGSGTLLNADGSRSKIPYYNGINVGIESWALPDIVAVVNNPNATITNLGVVQNEAGSVYQIHTVQPDPNNPDPVLANIQSVDYLIDPNTFMLLGTLNSTYNAGDLSQSYQRVVLFSNFNAQGAVTVPFNVAEMVGGQNTWSIQLTSVAFNVGLTDADFSL